MELIRSVLNTANAEIVKRARPTSSFDFARASVGNLFLTGARLFSGSFEAAIYLLSLICAIPPHARVLPAVSSNFTHHIAASLADGSVVAGQVAISHPSAPTALPCDHAPPADHHQQLHPRVAALLGDDDAAEDATPPGALPALRRPHIVFSKGADEEDLPARIERVWYINPYGHEIRPAANPKAVAALRAARGVVFSIGSLYTSIMPSVALRGVGAALAGLPAGVARVLVLNSRTDRETGPAATPMGAVEYVRAIARAAGESMGESREEAEEGGCERFVTHLVYLDGEGTPVVDTEALELMGISCFKAVGRWDDQGKTKILRYDEDELAAALERILDY
jgi:2-phospho-L-lactate transferase/gluconeogenesis factor (CofD/UPF0052 family)